MFSVIGNEYGICPASETVMALQHQFADGQPQVPGGEPGVALSGASLRTAISRKASGTLNSTFVSTASGGRVGPQTISNVRRGGHANLGTREEHE
jgi:hypothetical protein